VVNGEIKISPDYVNEKKELYTAVYPNSEIMGWYGFTRSLARTT
jgi:hypothetical protein